MFEININSLEETFEIANKKLTKDSMAADKFDIYYKEPIKNYMVQQVPTTLRYLSILYQKQTKKTSKNLKKNKTHHKNNKKHLV